jgi:PAS domain-containing protein
MKLLYVVAWVVIIGFLAWSGKLVVRIQTIGHETGEMHELILQLGHLASAWRDLGRPGNDVLENYRVDKHRAALAVYKRNYDVTHAAVQQKVQGDSTLAPLIAELEPVRDVVTGLGDVILKLAEQREALRLAQAPVESISEKETAAASAMARMDHTAQSGLDLILEASNAVVSRERELEKLQEQNFQSLYIMLLVTLLASAVSLESLRYILRQRATLRDSAARINSIVNNVVDGIVTVDHDGAI